MIGRKDVRILKILSSANDRAELNRKIHALEMNYQKKTSDLNTKFYLDSIKKILSIRR